MTEGGVGKGGDGSKVMKVLGLYALLVTSALATLQLPHEIARYLPDSAKGDAQTDPIKPMSTSLADRHTEVQGVVANLND